VTFNNHCFCRLLSIVDKRASAKSDVTISEGHFIPQFIKLDLHLAYRMHKNKNGCKATVHICHTREGGQQP